MTTVTLRGGPADGVVTSAPEWVTLVNVPSYLPEHNGMSTYVVDGSDAHFAHTTPWPSCECGDC